MIADILIRQKMNEKVDYFTHSIMERDNALLETFTKDGKDISNLVKSVVSYAQDLLSLYDNVSLLEDDTHDEVTRFIMYLIFFYYRAEKLAVALSAANTEVPVDYSNYSILVGTKYQPKCSGAAAFMTKVDHESTLEAFFYISLNGEVVKNSDDINPVLVYHISINLPKLFEFIKKSQVVDYLNIPVIVNCETYSMPQGQKIIKVDETELGQLSVKKIFSYLSSTDVDIVRELV